MDEPREERRRYKRVATAKPAIAASGDWVGRIADVSMGGLAIVHHGSAPWPRDIEEVEVQVERHRFRLPVTIITDQVMPGEPSRPLRRCGVQFKKLAPRQLHKLEHFIWSQAGGWPEIPFPEDDPR